MTDVGPRSRGPVERVAYKTGSTYTGVDESFVGQKPGIKKTVYKLDEGIYRTREVKLTLGYGGYDPERYKGKDGLKLGLTLPEKWLDGGVPASRLRDVFIKSYRKKHPAARLATAADSEWGLAIKDESLLLFSKKRLPDDAVITEALYDRQEVWAMGEWDWAEHEAALGKLRAAIKDDLANTMRHVVHDPGSIVPVTSRAQIQPGNTYVLLTGWYKQQCVLVQPEHTVADLKAYLHAKNSVRMPLESIDIGLRTSDDQIEVLDPALTLQQVYEKSIPGGGDKTAPQITARVTDAAEASPVLAPGGGEVLFSAADVFGGARPGFVFKVGPHGLGYYGDTRGGVGLAAGGVVAGKIAAANGDASARRGAAVVGGATSAEQSAVAAARAAGTAAEADLRDASILGMPERLRLALERRRDEAVARLNSALAGAAGGAESHVGAAGDGDGRAGAAARAAEGEAGSTEAEAEAVDVEGISSRLQGTGLRPDARPSGGQSATRIGGDDDPPPIIEDVPEGDAGGGESGEGDGGVSVGGSGKGGRMGAGGGGQGGGKLGAGGGGGGDEVPSFLGRAMVLGVGKRVQDRKHRIWLPSVHDPWSFRTPDDEQPTGGTTHAAALPAPKGWTGPAETQPSVNADESCSVM